jgi:hypothetical protein
MPSYLYFNAKLLVRQERESIDLGSKEARLD